MQQLQAELLPSPARCLDAMRELLPRLAREKCDEFLHYISFSSSKIEKPMLQNLDAFTTYLLNLKVRWLAYFGIQAYLHVNMFLCFICRFARKCTTRLWTKS